MLILFSDIHLTDESTSSNVHPSAFDILKKEILLAAKKQAKDTTKIDTLLDKKVTSGLNTIKQVKVTVRELPIPIGWEKTNLPESCFSLLSCEWWMKILGWILTALALSLGAPFWFDMLKKVMSIRNVGKNPDEKKEK